MPYAAAVPPSSLAAIARLQQGAVGREQLIGLGWSEHLIEAQVAARRWQIPVPGVVVLHTGPLPRATREWAAWLHCGRDAVLSHGTAGDHHGIERLADDRVRVLVPHGRKVAPPAWVVVYRSRVPQQLRAVRLPGLPPLTSPADTVLDLVGDSPGWGRTLGLVSMAVQGRSVEPAHLLGAMATRKRQRHRQLIKEVLSEAAAGATTPLEIRYRRNVERAHGLPEARRQHGDVVRRGRVVRDVDYVPYQLLVELDGRLGHDSYEGRFRDGARDNAALMRGKATLRFGWVDVGPEQACRTATQVATVLSRLGWSGRPIRCPRCHATGQLTEPLDRASYPVA